MSKIFPALLTREAHEKRDKLLRPQRREKDCGFPRKQLLPRSSGEPANGKRQGDPCPPCQNPKPKPDQVLTSNLLDLFQEFSMGKSCR